MVAWRWRAWPCRAPPRSTTESEHLPASLRGAASTQQRPQALGDRARAPEPQRFGRRDDAGVEDVEDRVLSSFFLSPSAVRRKGSTRRQRGGWATDEWKEQGAGQTRFVRPRTVAAREPRWKVIGSCTAIRECRGGDACSGMPGAGYRCLATHSRLAACALDCELHRSRSRYPRAGGTRGRPAASRSTLAGVPRPFGEPRDVRPARWGIRAHGHRARSTRR